VKEASKAALISIVFFAFFLGFGAYNYFSFGVVNNSIDFAVHWGKVQDLTKYPVYPGGYHVLFSVFDSSELLFYIANIALICLIVPSLLYFGTKTWWATLIYFCGVSLPHLWIYGATYPQAFVFTLLIIYLLNRKKPLIFALCTMLASVVHKEGVYLFALILVAEVFEYLANKVWACIKPKMGLGEFSLAGAVVLRVQKFNDIWQLLFFLVTQISLPIWFFGKTVFKKPFWLVLVIAPLFLLQIDARLISITQLALIFVTAPEIAKSKHKKIVIALLGIQLVFFLLDFGLATQSLIKTKSF